MTMLSSARRDWFIVAFITLSFIVIPLVILWRPPALPWRVSFILLPLIPGVVLAAIAVWYALSDGTGAD